MNAVIVNRVRRGFYLDSVALMRFSRVLAGTNGVAEAALMMGTPANRQIMADANLLDEAGAAAAGGDLVIAIRADSADAAAAALLEADALLDAPATQGTTGVAWRPRTLRAAVRSLPEATLALISVPGDFAIAEARKAIRRGLHAMIFSDNVDLAAETALKREARDLGRLVMGPDCGTAIINGVPLAFANRVPRGPVGVIGASGTGLQEVTSLIARHGGGISQAIGVGGRDLAREVGAISTLMALDALAVDPQTERLVIVSKPPADAVAALVLDRVAGIGKPVTICFIGAGDLTLPANAVQVATLKAAAETACGVQSTDAPVPDISATGHLVRGLYSGGTLCAEARAVFAAAGAAGHSLIDLGDDAYTQGRPHPMIDPAVRDTPIVEALEDPETGAVLVDIVIGYGAHDDPAGHLAALLKAHRRAGAPPVIASVTGTEEDPQCRSAQIATLEAAGVHVAPTNADAAAWALSAVR